MLLPISSNACLPEGTQHPPKPDMLQESRCLRKSGWVSADLTQGARRFNSTGTDRHFWRYPGSQRTTKGA